MTRGLSFPQLAEGLLLGAVAVCALVMSAPPDTYWHLRPGQACAPLFHQFGLTCAFLPAEDAMAGRLRTDGWRTTYADDRWAVLAAPAGPPP